MKTKLKVRAGIAVLLSLAGAVTGQTLNSLVNFSGGNGANPQAGLVAAGTMLYGTTSSGGNSNFGTVFAISTSGVVSNLHSFNGTTYNTNTQTYTSTDGANPVGTLLLSGSALYGTTSSGGASDNGTVFSVNTDGSGYSNLFSFGGGGPGADPEAGLVISGNTLFGTTFTGGTAGEGSVFRINTDGTDFTNIYSFTGGTNGSNPESTLVQTGATLYGTTYGPFYGGTGHGTVFKVNTDGSSFSNVYTFSGGSDGAFPEAGLLLAGSALYGTTSGGGDFSGSSGDGTVFTVNTNGGGFHSYPFNYTDGSTPQAGLLLVGGTLYGTTANGGSQGWGAIFQVNTNGGSFSNVYSFTDAQDGATPEAGLTLLGGALYGTTQADDAYGFGTVFSLTVPGLAPAPTLNIARGGGQVTLTWSNPAFSLQSAPALNSNYSNVSGAASPFTTNVSNKQQFFRLEGN